MNTAQIIRSHLHRYKFTITETDYSYSRFMCVLLQRSNDWEEAREVSEFVKANSPAIETHLGNTMFQVVLQHLPLTVEEMNTCLTRLYSDWDNRYSWLQEIKEQVNPEHRLYVAKSPLLLSNVGVIRAPDENTAEERLLEYTSMAFTIHQYTLRVLTND